MAVLVLAILLSLFLAPLALVAAWQILLWTLGPGSPPAGSLPAPEGPGTVLVLIPAHNEAKLLPACLDSVDRQTLPSVQRRTIVLADRCTDATAAIARERGVEVLQREEGAAGKGALLQWALDELRDELPRFEALAILDGDSQASPEWLLRSLLRLPQTPVVQAHHTVRLIRGGILGRLMAANARVRRRVLGARDRFGLASPLLGTGMVFRSKILSTGWTTTGLTEDREMGAALLVQGLVPRYDAWSEVQGEPPHDLRSGTIQRQRWIRGEILLATSYGAKLIVKGLSGFVPALEQALWMISPSTPVRLVAIAVIFLLAVPSGAAWLYWLALTIGLLDAIPMILTLLRRGPRGILDLSLSPFFLVWRVVLGVRALLPGRHTWRSTREERLS